MIIVTRMNEKILGVKFIIVENSVNISAYAHTLEERNRKRIHFEMNCLIQ